MFVVIQRREVAQQGAIGRGILDELEVANFAGLENAWRGEQDFGIGPAARISEKRHRVLVTARIFEVAIDQLHTTGDRGIELGKVAAQHRQARGGGIVLWLGGHQVLAAGVDHRPRRFFRARIELCHEIATQLVERRKREMAIAFKLVVECRQLKGRVAQTPELRSQRFRIERALRRRLQCEFTAHADVATTQLKRIARPATHLQLERNFFLKRPRVLPKFPQLGFELRIRCLVHRMTRLDPLEIDAAIGAMENNAAIFDFPNARALLEVAVLTGIKDHAIAGRERHAGRVRELDPSLATFGDLAEKRSAFFPEAAVREVRMIRPREPAGREPARKCHFERVAVVIGDLRRGIGLRRIERLAIDARDRRNILGRLEAALDLE